MPGRTVLGRPGRGPDGGPAGRAAGLGRPRAERALPGRPVPQPAVRPGVDHGPLAGGRPAPGGSGGRPARPSPTGAGPSEGRRRWASTCVVVGADEVPADLVAVGLAVLAGERRARAGRRPTRVPPASAIPAGRRPVHGPPGRGSRPRPDRCWRLRGRGRSGDVLVVGLGPADGLDPERWRRAAAGFVRAAGRRRSGRPGPARRPLPGGDRRRSGRRWPKGPSLAAYRFDGYKSDPRPPGSTALLVVGPPGPRRSADRGGAAGVRAAAAVTLGPGPDQHRRPAISPRPVGRGGRGDAPGRPTGTTVEVWDEPRIVDERLGGLLGVSRGSARAAAAGARRLRAGRPGDGGRRGCPTSSWWARASPSTRAACRSRRPRA